jgi:integrase
VLAVCKAIFYFGMQEKVCTENPCLGIDTNPEPQRKRYLRPDELQRMHKALDDGIVPDQRAENCFRLKMWTGARIGETLAAEWTDVPDAYGINLETSIWKKPGSTTKQKTVHEVHLNKPALAMLRKMRAAAPGEKRVFPGLTYDAVKDDWTALLKAAKIQDFRRHDLRHNFASAVLSKGGYGLSDVGALLGHADPKTTLRYAHLIDERLKAAGEVAGKALAPRRKPRREK